MTWREELEILTGSQGSVEIEVDVQIVNPRTCRGFGCSAITLRSDSYSIP